MKRNSAVLIGISAAVLILSGGTILSDVSGNSSAGTCSVDCHFEFWTCAANQHIAPPGQTDKVGAGGHTGCSSGSCCVKHPDCFQSCDGFASLQSAWESKNTDALIKEIETLREKAVLNRERHAIQITGCGGLVVMHLPLSAEFFTKLSHALN